MPRPARITADKVLTAAAKVVAEDGPAGASIARIGQVLRAPTGSIYHRFPSKSVLLGNVWLRAAREFQDAFAARLDGPDPVKAGLAAVRYVPEYVSRSPVDARVLLLHRRSDFLDSDWPADMRERAEGLHRQLVAGIRHFAQRVAGRTDPTTLRIVSFALAEAPLAAVRPHVEAGEAAPEIVETLIEETYSASLALLK